MFSFCSIILSHIPFYAVGTQRNYIALPGLH